MLHSDYFKVSATGLVIGCSTQVYSVVLTAGGATATLTLYDAKDGVSGIDFLTLSAVTNTSVDHHYGAEHGVLCKTGIYAVISGSGAIGYVEMNDSGINSLMTSTSTSTSTTSTSTSTTSTSTSTS